MEALEYLNVTFSPELVDSYKIFVRQGSSLTVLLGLILNVQEVLPNFQLLKKLARLLGHTVQEDTKEDFIEYRNDTYNPHIFD